MQKKVVLLILCFNKGLTSFYCMYSLSNVKWDCQAFLAI